MLIAPHAGYIYSGPTAAIAYSQLAGRRSTARRVLLLGPSHRVPFRGLALTSASWYATPLGDVVEYLPTVNETLVCMGIWAFGALIYSWMLHVAIPILKGQLRDHVPVTEK